MSRQRTFNLADLFEVVAGCVPDRTAFRCGAHSLTFRELDQRANRFGSALRARGLGRGDHVGIQLHNSLEYLESFIGCCKVGAVPVNVNYRYVSEELHYLFSTLDLKGLVYGEEFEAEVAATVPRVATLKALLRVGGTPPAGVESYAAATSSASADLDDPGRSDDDIYMLCTGGTTGMPKGVMWPHKSIFMAALGGGGIYFRRPPIQRPEELAEFVPHGPPLVFFPVAPMMHGAAMWATLISLFAGYTVVVNDQPSFDPEHVWDVVVRDGVNILSIVGDAMALPLVRALEQHPGRWDLSRLFVFGSGGAIFTEQAQARLKAVVPHIVTNNGMGSSESGVLGGRENSDRSGAGYIVLDARPDLGLIDDAGRIVTAPGSEGILARTGYVPVGYYGDPVKSAATFVKIDGRTWAITGDRARVDADGNFVVLGRGSQCINTGGEKVYPEEVEEAALRYGAIKDVLVVGTPDERWGQRVTAVVALLPGRQFDQAEFERVCRERLAGYKVPRSVCIVEEVKRSPAGKADYGWAKRVATEKAGG